MKHEDDELYIEMISDVRDRKCVYLINKRGVTVAKIPYSDSLGSIDNNVDNAGVTLSNTSHPIDGGLVSNTGSVAMALNEASLESAIERFFNR